MVFFFFQAPKQNKPEAAGGTEVSRQSRAPPCLPPAPPPHTRTHTHLASPVAVLVVTGKGQVDDLLNGY